MRFATSCLVRTATSFAIAAVQVQTTGCMLVNCNWWSRGCCRGDFGYGTRAIGAVFSPACLMRVRAGTLLVANEMALGNWRTGERLSEHSVNAIESPFLLTVRTPTKA
ncbi:hypothetical protein G7K_0706-t1 [Saitoella complicata NRRL Y-17804]|uniref:Secreted protein n=1 Tax=Saitoella complicata (strain BCRC 22490 / CBS 7301 / JCM 7358 / NBRC 10748 / NRRL Y-17804) TaxID=698492 RepID=A0A0E9NAN9_SAICN|nr:hypothetical protein G7K_0706-t1 [Saitoella complicata NRRL Y-17804]